jgi:hypothetical protein
LGPSVISNAERLIYRNPTIDIPEIGVYFVLQTGFITGKGLLMVG